MPSKIPQRCKFFTEDGSPIRFNGVLGCKRKTGQCWFTHPDQPEWDLTSYGSDGPVLIPSPSIFRERDVRRSRSRERRRSPDHRYSSSRRREMSGHSPGPSRISRRDSDRGRRSRSPPSSVASSDFFERLRRRDSRMDVGGSGSKDVDEERELRQKRDEGKDGSSAYSNPSPKASSSQHKGMEPPPPPGPPPLQPPPPVPVPPKFLLQKPPHLTIPAPPPPDTKNDPTLEEKKAIWMERIKRMSDTVQARTDFLNLESEIQKCRSLMQCSRYGIIPEADKSRMSSHVTSLEQRLEKKKGDLATHLAQLVESDSWPVAIQRDADEAVETTKKYEEMVESVAELRDTVHAMNEALVVIVGDRNMKIEADQEEMRNTMAMDVDEDGEKLAGVVPLKRRRISTDQDDEVGEGLDEVAGKDLEAVRDTLLSLEARVAELENNITQQHQELMEEVNQRIEMKLEDLKGADAAVLQEASDKLAEVERIVNSTGKEMDEIAGEVASLITWSSSADEEIAQQKVRLEQMQTSNTEMRETIEIYREMQEQDRREIASLAAGLVAYDESMSPPTSPELLPMEFVLKAVEEPIVERVRRSVLAAIEELRMNVAVMLQERNQEMYDALWSKLSLTLRMVEALKAQILEEEAGLAQVEGR